MYDWRWPVGYKNLIPLFNISCIWEVALLFSQTMHKLYFTSHVGAEKRIGKLFLTECLNDSPF